MLRKGPLTALMVLAMTAILCMTIAPVQAASETDLEKEYWSWGKGMDWTNVDYRMSDDGDTIAVIGPDNDLFVLDVGTKTVLWEYQSSVGISAGIPFEMSSDGSHIMVVDIGGTMSYFNVDDGNVPKWTYDAGGWGDLAMDRNGSFNVFAMSGQVLTFDDEGLSSTFSDPTLTPLARVVLSADSRDAVVYQGGYTLTYRSGTWDPYDQGMGISAMLISNEGDIVVTLYDDTNYYVTISTDSGGMIWTPSPQGVAYGDIHLSKDGSSIVVSRNVGPDYITYMLDVMSQSVVWEKRMHTMGNSVVSGDGETLLTTFYWYEAARTYDKWTGLAISQTDESGYYPAISWDGDTVALMGSNGLQVFRNVAEDDNVVVVDDDDDRFEQLQMLSIVGIVLGAVAIVLIIILMVRKK